MDSRWMRRLGLPRASMISRAYSSLWGLLILSSSFQHRPSPFYTHTQKVQSFSVWQKNTEQFQFALSISSSCRFRNWSLRFLCSMDACWRWKMATLEVNLCSLILRDWHLNSMLCCSAINSWKFGKCGDWPCHLRCSGRPAASWDM